MNAPKRRKYTSGEKALTKGQLNKLLEYITDLEERVLIKTAVVLGIRRNDIVQLRVGDIDFETLRLVFYEHKKKRNHIVPIPTNLANELAMLIKVNKTKRSEFLFPGRHGKGHMSSKTAYNILQKNLEKAGLPHKPFHALRATCIKLHQQEGWTVEQTAKLIGDTVAVVQEHYATPSDEELAEVMAEKPII
jgi:integrase/recombinase XerD